MSQDYTQKEKICIPYGNPEQESWQSKALTKGKGHKSMRDPQYSPWKRLCV